VYGRNKILGKPQQELTRKSFVCIKLPYVMWFVLSLFNIESNWRS